MDSPEFGLNGHIRSRKGAMILAPRIIRDAIRAGTAVGDFLPTERVMLEKYQTGRATLREALRLLEFQGVIQLKPGHGGGPMLVRPDSAHLSETLLLIMQLNEAPFRNIVEVRTAVEPAICALAAEKISDQGILRLRDNLKEMSSSVANPSAFLDLNKEFHDLIAHYSGNVAFAYLVHSLLDIIDGTVMGITYSLPQRVAMVGAHDAICDAIASRNPDEARERMTSHIGEYAEHVERRYSGLLDEVVPWERWQV